MTLDILAYVAACVLLIVTPGPGVLSVAGVGSGYGFARGSRYLWGLCIGNAIVALAVASGIAAAVFSIPYVRESLLAVSVAYMLYLAAKIAFAGSKVGFIEATRAPALRDGLFLQIVNPKAYVANSPLFSGFALFPGHIVIETAVKFVIWVAIWVPVHFAWLFAGVMLHKLNLSPSLQRLINIFMAATMLIVIILALFSGSNAV